MRDEPERVLRVDRVDRALRAEPVRVEGLPCVPVVTLAAAGTVGTAFDAAFVEAPPAIPQASQYPSSIVPEQPARVQLAITDK